MNDPHSPYVEEIGPLDLVTGAWALSADSRSPNARCDQFLLSFEKRSILIAADPEDDTVDVNFGDITLPYTVELTDRDPWRRLVGCGVLWTWRLTNQHGYSDGFQVELGRPGECWALQFMAEGGAISVRSIGPIEGLWNQFTQP